MGDEKHYTIQIKGTAYKFKPVPSEDYERIAVVQNLSTDQAKTIRALTRLLANSAGEEAWDALTDRYLSGEITLRELTVDVFERLVKRQAKDEQAEGVALAGEDAE